MTTQDIPLVIALLIIASISLAITSFDILEPDEKKKFLGWCYRNLPRLITKRHWFQGLHFTYMQYENYVNFWSRCFPNNGCKVVDIGVGYHCIQCHRFYSYVEGTPVETIPNAGDILKAIT